MMEIKDEEDSEPSMNQDMTKFIDFCCKKNLFINCKEDEMCIYTLWDHDSVMDFKFSDLYYPKNLLRTLKEKLKTLEEKLNYE